MMVQLPLLIGQAPGPNTDPTLPLYPIPESSAGGRLKQFMGLSRGEYMTQFDRVNLLPGFPGKHKRDDKFPMTQAKFAAAVMRPHLAGRRVILVGRNVANAFRLEEEFLVWTTMKCRRREPLKRCMGLCDVAIVPHPSGRSRWYSDPVNLEMSQQFWAEFSTMTP